MKPEFKTAAPILPMLDAEKCKDFYTQKLGFRLNGDYPGYLIFVRDDIQLHFWISDDEALCRASGCYLYVAGIEQIYEEFSRAKVIHPNGKLKATDYGLKEFAALDCFGNLLRIGEPTEN